MSTNANKKTAEKKTVEKRAKKADEKEPKPEKKRSAYQEFCDKHRQRLKDEGLSFGEVSKKLGEMWAADPSNPSAGKTKKAKKETSAPADEKLAAANSAKIIEHQQAVAAELKVED